MTLSALFAGPWGPLIIFLMRVGDVSLSTVRMLLAVRNAWILVPCIAVFEVTIWLFAAGSALQNMRSPLHLLGYATGFATGNVVGMWLEEKLAYGFAAVRIIVKGRQPALAARLREMGFGVTELTGQGRSGPVEILLAVSKRRDVPRIVSEASDMHPDAFITVEEPKTITRGWLFPRRK